MTNRHGKNRSAKRRMGHKRPAPSDRLPEETVDHISNFKAVGWYGLDGEIHYFKEDDEEQP